MSTQPAGDTVGGKVSCDVLELVFVISHTAMKGKLGKLSTYRLGSVSYYNMDCRGKKERSAF